LRLVARIRAGACASRLLRVRQIASHLQPEVSRLDRLNYIAKHEGRFAVTGAPGGYDAYLAAEAARRRKGLVLFVTSDDAAERCALDALAFFATDIPLLDFPAWDCLPYDRVSPKPYIESQRLATLSGLARRKPDSPAAVVVTTVNAVLQRVPPRA